MQIGDDLARLRRVVKVLGDDAVGEAHRPPPTPPDHAVVGSALGVVDRRAIVGNGRPAAQPRSSMSFASGAVATTWRRDHEDGPAQLGDGRYPGTAGEDDPVGDHRSRRASRPWPEGRARGESSACTRKRALRLRRRGAGGRAQAAPAAPTRRWGMMTPPTVSGDPHMARASSAVGKRTRSLAPSRSRSSASACWAACWASDSAATRPPPNARSQSMLLSRTVSAIDSTAFTDSTAASQRAAWARRTGRPGRGTTRPSR